MQVKLPVYSCHATSRDQTHLVKREISLGKALAAIAAGSLVDVSPERDRKRGHVTYLQEPMPERKAQHSPASISWGEMLRNAGAIGTSGAQAHAQVKVREWDELTQELRSELTVNVSHEALAEMQTLAL